MTTQELHDRLDEATSGPMAKILLGALCAILLGLSTWTLITLQSHSTLLESSATHQKDMDIDARQMADDVREIRKDIQEGKAEIGALRQRMDDLLPPPHSDHP